MIPAKLIVGGIVLIVALAALSAGILHYRGLLAEIKQLHTDKALLQTAVQLKDSQITSLKAQAESARERQEEVQEKFAEARAQAERVKTLFANHKFDKLARAKPGLISRKMQRATAKVFDEIEEIGNEDL